MEIILDTKKSIEENAGIYFDKAKKAKKKIQGVKKALLRFEQEKKELIAKKEKASIEYDEKEIQRTKPKREKKWHEKFRWFYSSEGFLCIGGRDATTNEIIVKKHSDKDDVVFHTELPGSPFFVVKCEGKKPGEATLKQASQATASYSRAWKMGLGTASVYWVKPEQISKDIGLPKGSFMIHGKRNYYEPSLEIAVGILKDGIVMGGPVDAVKQNCDKFVVVVQGKEKKTDAAKKIAKILNADIDDVVSALPAGDCGIKG